MNSKNQTTNHQAVEAAIAATDFSDKPPFNKTPIADAMPNRTGFASSFYGDYSENTDSVTSVTNERYDSVTKNNLVTVTHHFGFNFANGDELAIHAKAPNFLVNNFLETDSHGMLAGVSMTFKTFTALRLAHSICTGNDFMGHAVYKMGKVLIVNGEGAGAFARRAKALSIVEGDFNNNLVVLNDAIRIDNKSDMARLKQAIDQIQPVLVIFDTFASLISETEENSPSDVGRALRLIKETCRNGNTSSMIVHHHGKDAAKGMRGASNFTNDVDFSFELTRSTDAMMTTLSCKKMKDGENFNDIHMEAQVVELDLTRQDGNKTTSLVMTKSDYVPAKKSTNRLSPNSERALQNLRNALVTHGVTPPKLVTDLFPDSPENAPHKVVTFNQWREIAIESISVSTDPSDTKKVGNAKRKALWDSKKQLQTYGFIGVEGDYIWITDRF